MQRGTLFLTITIIDHLVTVIIIILLVTERVVEYWHTLTSSDKSFKFMVLQMCRILLAVTQGETQMQKSAETENQFMKLINRNL